MLKNSLLLTLTLLFSACGGGGTSVEPTPLKTLYFIDSPVNGIDYHCGVRSGITKHDTVEGKEKDGVLYCSKGTITFSLGSLVLGSIEQYKDKQEIRPQDLMHVSQDNFESEQVLKIALLLQSLDDDGEIEKNINIDEATKNKLTQTSLDDLSLSKVGELIKDIGEIPKDLNEVKKHLIRNSSISYEDSKPKITPFNEEISSSLSSGSVVGTLSISEGDSTLISLTLLGDGIDNFQLNSDGTILLLRKIDTPSTFNLIVKAENIFGVTEEHITITVIGNTNKLGKVQLGDIIIANAHVKIYQFNYDGLQLIATTETDSKGNFDLHTKLLLNLKNYLYEVSEGKQVDIENNKIKNKSILRLIAKGEFIKKSSKRVRITPLSELLYDYVAKDIKNDVNIYWKIDNVAKVLLSQDLNGDNKIDREDIMIFDPLHNQNSLYKTLKRKNTYSKIVNKITKGDTDYLDILFTSHLLHFFEGADDFKIVGSFVYYFMPNDGTFYIYDLNNDKIISKLFLDIPNYNISDMTELFSQQSNFIVTLNIDAINNKIYITNLNEYTYILDINDLKEPKILNKFNTGYGTSIENRFNNILWIKKANKFISNSNSEDTTFEDFINEIIGEENNSTIEDEAYTIYDISNPNIPTIIENNLPVFDKMSKHFAYSVDSNNCKSSNIIKVSRYKIADMSSDKYMTPKYETTLNIPSNCSESKYFSEFNLFLFDKKYTDSTEEEYTQSLYGYYVNEIVTTYAITEENYLQVEIDKILFMKGWTLYTYVDNMINILDISGQSVRYIEKIPYRKKVRYRGKENSIKIDNLDISFRNNLMISSQKVIDFPSFKFSATYTENNEGIEYDLFKKLEL